MAKAKTKDEEPKAPKPAEQQNTSVDEQVGIPPTNSSDTPPNDPPSADEPLPPSDSDVPSSAPQSTSTLPPSPSSFGMEKWPESEVNKPVMFEGAEVVSILMDGKETPTEYHCKMSDGTTRHVPKTLFK